MLTLRQSFIAAGEESIAAMETAATKAEKGVDNSEKSRQIIAEIVNVMIKLRQDITATGEVAIAVVVRSFISGFTNEDRCKMVGAGKSEGNSQCLVNGAENMVKVYSDARTELYKNGQALNADVKTCNNLNEYLAARKDPATSEKKNLFQAMADDLRCLITYYGFYQKFITELYDEVENTGESKDETRLVLLKNQLVFSGLVKFTKDTMKSFTEVLSPLVENDKAAS